MRKNYNFNFFTKKSGISHNGFSLALLFLLISISVVQAQTTYYVDNKNENASDSNLGTQEAPFLTIKKAIQIAQSGDVCKVSEGIYRESLNGFQTGGVIIELDLGNNILKAFGKLN